MKIKLENVYRRMRQFKVTFDEQVFAPIDNNELIRIFLCIRKINIRKTHSLLNINEFHAANVHSKMWNASATSTYGFNMKTPFNAIVT